jgi:hypothetical protein
MLGKGFWADVEIAGEHLRLFSEDNAQGVQVSVYDVIAKCWIVPSEAAEDIEQGKEKAEEYATAYLRQNGQPELPPLILVRLLLCGVHELMSLIDRCLLAVRAFEADAAGRKVRLRVHTPKVIKSGLSLYLGMNKSSFAFRAQLGIADLGGLRQFASSNSSVVLTGPDCFT